MHRLHTLRWRSIRWPSLRWPPPATYAIIIFLLMAVLAGLLTRELGVLYAGNLEAQFRAQAGASAAQPGLIDVWQGDASARTTLLRTWSTLLGARVTLLSTDGHILADSHDQVSSAAPDASPPPELRAAMETGFGRSVRYDPVSGRDVAFLAFPVQDGDQLLGAIRWAYPLDQVRASTRQIDSLLNFALLAAGLLILGLFIVYIERTARTVRRLTTVAERIEAGDLEARVVSFSGGEVGQLARTFNRMAATLERQFSKREREKDRLTTMLHVMADGVIMVSKKGKVRLINPAATRILNTTEADALKHSFVQTVRDHRIVEVWQRCKESGSQEIATIDLGDQRYLQIVVTPYLLGAARGYLIMLQDLSRIRRLQTIRQDFVSNVSHELRTPLAALRALVETLRDGALEDPPMAQHFLDLMEGEVDSLTQMVQELLELSRIESGQVPFKFEAVAADQLLSAGAVRLAPQAERAGITLILALPAGLPNVRVDAQRVQQVVINLIHNAIKFTPPGGSIKLSAETVDDHVIVVVTDTGAGIPTADLPRIFERFYKSDRARSGSGTGLGLAIAKHVVHAHGGEIWAESVEGEGSTFYLTLPIAGADFAKPIRATPVDTPSNDTEPFPAPINGHSSPHAPLQT